VTADEIADRITADQALGERDGKQNFNTNDMAHKIPRCVEWVTSIHTLEPGDVLATGHQPSRTERLPGGDRIEVETEGLGRCASTSATPSSARGTARRRLDRQQKGQEGRRRSSAASTRREKKVSGAFARRPGAAERPAGKRLVPSAALRTFTIDPRFARGNRWALWFFGVVACSISRCRSFNGRSRARLVALWLCAPSASFSTVGSRGSHIERRNDCHGPRLCSTTMDCGRHMAKDAALLRWATFDRSRTAVPASSGVA